MNERQRRMVGHGAILMVFGLIAGFGLVMSLVGGFEIFPGTMLEFSLPSDSGGWARTHAGGILNGIMLFTVALVLWGMRLPEQSEGRIFWMVVGAGYANTLFYWGGMLADNRALTFGDNRFGETSLMGVIGLLPALVFAFVTIIAMLIIAKHAFGEKTAPASMATAASGG